MLADFNYDTQVIDRPHAFSIRHEVPSRTHPLEVVDRMTFRYLEQIAAANVEDDPTILIVEDEPMIRDLLAEVLQESGYTIIGAESAEAAVPYLTDENQRIDLMLSDVGLPGMDGNDLAIVARDYRPSLKVLFVTGNPSGSVCDKNTDVIAKPFRASEVTEHVSAML